MPNARRGKSVIETDADSDSGYRLGLQASHRGELTAAQTLNTALESSLARGDVRGAALASAALSITGQVMGNFRGFPGHMERLALVRDRSFAWRSLD